MEALKLLVNLAQLLLEIAMALYFLGVLGMMLSAVFSGTEEIHLRKAVQWPWLLRDKLRGT